MVKKLFNNALEILISVNSQNKTIKDCYCSHLFILMFINTTFPCGPQKVIFDYGLFPFMFWEIKIKQFLTRLP